MANSKFIIIKKSVRKNSSLSSTRVKPRRTLSHHLSTLASTPKLQALGVGNKLLSGSAKLALIQHCKEERVERRLKHRRRFVDALEAHHAARLALVAAQEDAAFAWSLQQGGFAAAALVSGPIERHLEEVAPFEAQAFDGQVRLLGALEVAAGQQEAAEEDKMDVDA